MSGFVGDEVWPRIVGVGKLGAGVAAGVAGSALCDTGLGCAIGGTIMAFGADVAGAGLRQVWSGRPAPTAVGTAFGSTAARIEGLIVDAAAIAHGFTRIASQWIGYTPPGHVPITPPDPAPAAAEGGARLLPPAIRVPLGNARFGLEHILRRHAFTSGAEGVSKFARGMGHIEIRGLIHEANAASAAWRVEGSSRVLDVGMGRIIGTDPTGAATSGLRVVTTADGDVITAYPIPWP